jgi:hypothetical protein
MVRLRRRRRPNRGLLSTLLLGNLPPGMQFALESRAHTVFTVVIIAALVGTGIISIRWDEGGPELGLDQDRARQLGSQAVDRFRDSDWSLGVRSEWRDHWASQGTNQWDDEWEDGWEDKWQDPSQAEWTENWEKPRGEVQLGSGGAETRPGRLSPPPPEWRPPSIARNGSTTNRDVQQPLNVDRDPPSPPFWRLGADDPSGGRGTWR